MYHSYSRPGSPLPNPLLDRASQHRAGSEVKTDSTMASQGLPSMNAVRSANGSTSPQNRSKRAPGNTGPLSQKRNGEASSTAEVDKRRGVSPVAGTIEETEGYRPRYPDSRDPSPLPGRGLRRVDSESARRESGSYGSSVHHASTKRCSDCGRTEAEVGLILPLTEEGGTQYCKGCCESFSEETA